MSKPLLRFLGIYLTINAIAAVGLLLTLWPYRAASSSGWILLFVIALPVTALGEWLGESFLKNRMSLAVERATQRSNFSWIRIAYVLAMALIVILIVTFIGSHWTHDGP
ncbi:MAG TPA: hypothetical protein VIH50_00235 [Steroidobacteraceae bacterium]